MLNEFPLDSMLIAPGLNDKTDLLLSFYTFDSPQDLNVYMHIYIARGQHMYATCMHVCERSCRSGRHNSDIIRLPQNVIVCMRNNF